ncbi:MAG: hypothetical protein ACSNEK_03150 [Parachlamydiaceae bacterium]
MARKLFKGGQELGLYLLNMAKKHRLKRPCSWLHCDGLHEPNKDTRHALRESRQGNGDLFHTLAEFWNAMEVNPHVKD